MSTTSLKTAIILFLALTLASCKENAPEKTTIKRDNAEIDYRMVGDGGATLLFIHGLNTDQKIWDSQLPYFSTDYRVVTFDLPGHGNSGKKRSHFSFQGYAGDVYSMIKRLNLKNVILIGHGSGAEIALMAATYRPKNVIGFIAIENFRSAGKSMGKRNPKIIDKILADAQTNYFAASEAYARKYLLSGQTPDTLLNRISRYNKSAYPTMGKQILPELLTIDQTEKRLLPKLHVKIHLINSDFLPTNNKALSKLAGSGLKFHPIKGSSAFPMFENPDQLNAVLRQAIEEISRENDTVRVRV